MTRAIAVGTLACAFVGSARAQDPTEEPPVEVHGFVSQGFIVSTHHNYLARSERGSFEFTEVGLNVTKALGAQLRTGVQLFARDLGPIGNYRPQFDWFYLDYRFADWLGIRAGRTKLPFGLYNDVNDVDSARVPVLLPQSLYPQQNRDLLLAQTGVELYGYVPLAAAGALDYRLYGGTIFLDRTSLALNDQVRETDVPYMVGGRAMWLTPLQGLELGFSLQALRLEARYEFDAATVAAFEQAGLVPPGFDGRLHQRVPAVLGVVSARYEAHDWLFAAEFSRWRLDSELRPPVVPDYHVTQTRGYAMVAYRVAPWFTPGAYYSVFDLGAAGGPTRETYQEDVAVTFRYDLHENWLVKLEGHFMRGTGGLTTELNPPPAGVDGTLHLRNLRRDWGVLLLKTTAFF